MRQSNQFSIIAAVALLSGCAAPPQLPEPAAEPAMGADRSAIFAERWASYSAWASRDGLQAGCEPRLAEPDVDVAYRGTVVLMHGFSACSQQYEDFVGLLSASGYRTVLAVLPGHGRPYPAVDKDNPNAQPDAGSWRDVYTAFAGQINGLMEYADGDRVIGGLSGGGTASLWLNLQAPELYDRNIVMAPFLDIAGGGFVNGTVAFLGAIPGLNNFTAKPFGAAKPCIAKREQGRAGYCSYNLRHVAGLKGLGKTVRTSMQTSPIDVRLQVIGVEHDPTVSNTRIHDVIEAQSATGRTSACFMPEGIPHSMFSRKDNPGTEMYWLEAFQSGVVEFIVDGKSMPTTGTVSETEAPWQLCRTSMGREAS
jgi:alpha-beta hydrolase superfamily lysophospholipase